MVGRVAAKGVFEPSDDRRVGELKSVRRRGPAIDRDNDRDSGARRNAPAPPAFLIAREVAPVADPPLMINWSVAEPVPPNTVFRVRLAPVPTYDPTVSVLNPPALGAENTTALLATLRLDIVDEPVIFQVVPFAKETLVVEVASV